jgi:O-antigen ligase
MSRRLEIGALVALCFFLPLYEAPKSIFCVLYLLIWIVNRIRARDFGGRWDMWDSLIAAWIASGFVVAAFAGAPGGDEWRGAIDLLRYGSVLWLAKRSRYEAREIRQIVAVLLFSTVVGVAMAYVEMWRGQEGGLQLNSVGHVNHTAIYLAISLGVCVAWLFAAWRSWSRAHRAVALAATLVILVALVHSASRGAIGMGLVVPLVLALGWRPWSRTRMLAAACLVAATGIVMLASKAEVLRKQEANVEGDRVLAFRSEIWEVALGTWREHPWFGVGMDNFGRMTPYRKALAESPQTPSMSIALRFAVHAHSLFLNTLAERGVVGSAALGALLAVLGLALLLRRPDPAAGEAEWLLWGCAAAAWLVTIGVGAVNTTLHHEHGILASLLFGLWLSKRPGR